VNLLSPYMGFLLSIVGEPLLDVTPPRVDYCAQMEQEIQGRKHGFLAGNKTYYIGGFHPVWNLQEEETIGFTHPFFNDLRGRGRGLVSHPDTGYGHDLSGWEFYKHTKVAYGSVVVDGMRYSHPAPVSMIWRPDRMIVEYEVGGVSIQEEKFIALNDVACTVITADQPIVLEFSGQSFADSRTTFTNATAQLDTQYNCVHIVEGGLSEAIPIRTNGVDVVLSGPLMYDGMSTVISASEPIENYQQTNQNGQQLYSFTLPCDTQGTALVWAMDDIYTNALTAVNELLSDPMAAKQAKTDYMNDILNDEIPYFRCSDQDIVDVYYYLWALQMMYMIDVGVGFEQYSHTQTAVHNFLGLHRFDANFQIQVGAWAADKTTYANGNALVWKALLPYSNLQTGRIPADNMGQAWYSGLEGSLAGHVVGAWKIYEHSGDESFLQEVYAFYRALMWNSIPGLWGYEYAAADRLSRMASILGYPQEEIDRWATVVNADGYNNWLNNMWEKNGVTNYFGAGEQNNPNYPQWRRKGWNSFAYLAMDAFPDEWSQRMTEYWSMNSTYGFNLLGHFATTAQIDWDLVNNKNFMVTPDAHWFGICGMYKHHVVEHANTLTLHHLKQYNMKWGIPIAPEALKETLALHGDQYSNFNAGKILLILEGIFGLSYSVVDDSFVVAEHMPDEWDYMETYVPITEDGRKYWTHVKVERSVIDEVESRHIEVNGNRMAQLKVEPWSADKTILDASSGYMTNQASGNIQYDFNNQFNALVDVQLTDHVENGSPENTFSGINLFNETFDDEGLNSAWIQHGAGHLGIVDGAYLFTDVRDEAGAELYRALSIGSDTQINSSIQVRLAPFETPNTKTDFTWSFGGSDGVISLNLNSYGRLQLRHNDFDAGVSVLSEITDVNYVDDQLIELSLNYDPQEPFLTVSYALNGGSPITLYTGNSGDELGLGDVTSSYTSAKLFKFNNDPVDQPYVSVEHWQYQLEE
jgi:hypothetical protein